MNKALIPFFDLTRQYSQIKIEIDQALARIFQKGFFVGGEEVEKFEQDFTEYIQVRHCISCGNGTDALELILRAYGIGPGDEVIVPDFTWISDGEVVSAVGAKPVFVDVLPDELTIDPLSIEEAITAKTKAIIAVHLYGMPCRMNEIVALGQKYGAKVIEDCAQAVGAKLNNKKVGSIGDAAAFSFYPTKNLGAYGDGGAVTTNDSSLAEKVRLLANHGQPVRDIHLIEGKNSRLDVIQAGALSIKLKYLDTWNKKRQEIASAYSNALNGRQIVFPDLKKDVDHVFHLYVIQTPGRDIMKCHLARHGVTTAIHYPKALHQMEAYKYLNLGDERFPVATFAGHSVLSLPIFPELDAGEVEYIIQVLNKYET